MSASCTGRTAHHALQDGRIFVTEPTATVAPGPPSHSTESEIGLHRVLEPVDGEGTPLTMPQAAARLDARSEIWPGEVRIEVETLNLDAASYRQLYEKHGGDGVAVRDEVLAIVAERGKMQNPVTGSGGMLIGTVAEVGPRTTGFTQDRLANHGTSYAAETVAH